MEFIVKENIVKLDQRDGGILCYISTKNYSPRDKHPHLLEKYFAINNKGVIYEYRNKDYKLITDDAKHADDYFIKLILVTINEKSLFLYQFLKSCFVHIKNNKPIYWLTGHKIIISDQTIIMDYKDLAVTIHIPNSKNLSESDIITYFLSQIEIIEYKYNNILKLKAEQTPTKNKKITCLKRGKK